VKVIDFGSSFDFSKANSAIELTTPEYLPPEVLEFIEFKKMNMGHAYNDEVKQKLNIEGKLWQWSIDVWSLGVILLEVVMGYPIWMSYKGRIINNHTKMSSSVMLGLFGVSGREPRKISKI